MFPELQQKKVEPLSGEFSFNFRKTKKVAFINVSDIRAERTQVIETFEDSVSSEE
jgi:hypothetical protein